MKRPLRVTYGLPFVKQTALQCQHWHANSWRQEECRAADDPFSSDFGPAEEIENV